ncbi:MAG: hypothetical protein LUQ44_04005 [Methanothrix sp.]|nr:hypothetical protein [Methanothrix sp.]
MMRKCRNQKGTERLTDAIAYRISASQREFLERMAEEKNIGLCEAARIVLDEARMKVEAIHSPSFKSR